MGDATCTGSHDVPLGDTGIGKGKDLRELIGRERKKTENGIRRG